MPASRYDILAEQGSTFKLHLHYKFSSGVGIDIGSFSGRMQVRRSSKDPQVILYLTENGVTGGGITGEYIPGIDVGISGVGGISFNTSINGTTGFTGGIFLRVDANTMTNVPHGKHFYDLEIQNTLGEVMRLMEGSFDVSKEITR